MPQSTPIKLFVLGTGWGVPFETAAPFPLKLATWMRMQGLDFEWHIENNPGKGPKGKSPWIEHGSVRMGDSSLIMEYLTEEFGLSNLDAGLTAEQVALSTATQRMLEEHYHQAFEHQLFFGRGADARLKEFTSDLPPIINVLLPKLLTRSFAKQLHARGLARHSEDVIVAQGREDIDALSTLLGQKSYFHGDTPTEIDACVFGFLGVTVYVEQENPLFIHAASRKNLVEYCERMRAKYFPKTLEKLPSLESPASLGNLDRSAA